MSQSNAVGVVPNMWCVVLSLRDLEGSGDVKANEDVYVRAWPDHKSGSNVPFVRCL